MVTITQTVVKPPAIKTTPSYQPAKYEIAPQVKEVLKKTPLGQYTIATFKEQSIQSLPKTETVKVTRELLGSADTVRSVDVQYTDAQKKAMEQYTNTMMGTWLLSKSAFAQKYIPALQAASLKRSLTQQGLEIVGKGSLEESNKALIATQEQLFQRELEYRQREQEWQDVLYKSTAEGAIAKGQLQDVTAAYQQLLAEPPKAEGLDWKQVLLWGGIGIALLAILLSVIRRK